jgi:hypothetical protein
MWQCHLGELPGPLDSALDLVNIFLVIGNKILEGLDINTGSTESCAVHIIHKLFSGKYAALIISAKTSVFDDQIFNHDFPFFP